MINHTELCLFSFAVLSLNFLCFVSVAIGSPRWSLDERFRLNLYIDGIPGRLAVTLRNCNVFIVIYDGI